MAHNIHKIFIDGGEGTTGLRLRERLAGREGIRLLEAAPDERKDLGVRLGLMAEADISVLCLPDEASREIVGAAEGACGRRRVIDASTAFRTAPGWVYGLPELEPGRRELIRGADRVSVPGCHATGFILMAAPLIRLGIADSGYPFACHSVTGFSGGGKGMIADYAKAGPRAPRHYALGQGHKHIPEMQAVSGAAAPILFSPIVADYYSGMLVTLPLHAGLLRIRLGPRGLYEAFSEYYAGQPLIRTVAPGLESADGFLDAGAMAGSDGLELLFCGSEDRPVLAARFDNLGKGASGAALQCMNIMLGLPETGGLAAWTDRDGRPAGFGIGRNGAGAERRFSERGHMACI
ncbi:MAG: N-acetyl-gamma-glutamyl-phosphate reductase [Clostridiales Family XIII bacterium]|jgi:N-acetyl-gamma-glutamyl-phosphate reductase|nr:N-acetyl-gamma-glutamyl-phosphate reductase [Clostridiales Family XIII bacterium]